MKPLAASSFNIGDGNVVYDGWRKEAGAVFERGDKSLEVNFRGHTEVNSINKVWCVHSGGHIRFRLCLLFRIH